MKPLEIIKRVVTVLTLILLTADMLTDLNLFPYALISFATYCFLKSKEYYDDKNKAKFWGALIVGFLIVIVIIGMILR